MHRNRGHTTLLSHPGHPLASHTASSRTRPGQLPTLIADAVLVASLSDAARHAADDAVRAALLRGVHDATAAIQARGSRSGEIGVEIVSAGSE